MRSEADRRKVMEVIGELGRKAKGPGRVYLVGGSSMVLLGTGRRSTIDVDLKLDPEPAGIFEAIATLKDSLEVNIELAAPDQFIPAVPGWQARSQFINSIGSVDFYHYDFYSQALAKLERSHERDLEDVRHLIEQGLVEPAKLWDCYQAIEADLIRFPAVNTRQLRRVVAKVCARSDESFS